jgi:hypothetical protein
MTTNTMPKRSENTRMGLNKHSTIGKELRRCSRENLSSRVRGEHSKVARETRFVGRAGGKTSRMLFTAASPPAEDEHRTKLFTLERSHIHMLVLKTYDRTISS